MSSNRPYHFSKKANRYISNTKQGNREYYYGRLKRITSCSTFDPNTTYGKYMMRHLIRMLRGQRKLEQAIRSQNNNISSLAQKEEERIAELKSKFETQRRLGIRDVAKTKAKKQSFGYYAAPFALYLLSTYLIFLMSEFLINAIALLVIVLFFVFATAYSIGESIQSKIIDKYLTQAENEYSGRPVEEILLPYKVKSEKILDEQKTQISTMNQELKVMNRTITENISELMGNKKLTFILSDDFYNSTDWIQIRDQAFNRGPRVCRYCGSTDDLTVDHIKPRSKYPELALTVNNTQILCRSCNSSKGNRVK